MKISHVRFFHAEASQKKNSASCEKNSAPDEKESPPGSNEEPGGEDFRWVDESDYLTTIFLPFWM